MEAQEAPSNTAVEEAKVDDGARSMVLLSHTMAQASCNNPHAASKADMVVGAEVQDTTPFRTAVCFKEGDTHQKGAVSQQQVTCMMSHSLVAVACNLPTHE